MSFIEVYDNYAYLGINSRPITGGPEFNMVKNFIDHRKELFQETPTEKMAIFIETKINNVYPDVIFCTYNPQEFEKWNNNRNKISTTDLKILHYIYSKGNVTSQRIIKDLSIQYKTFVNSIEALFDAELIDRKEGHWSICNNKSVFGVRHIEAVEAKIGKWEEVLQQAIINKCFASESSILYKRKNNPDSEVMRKTSEFGIGVYLYNDENFSCFSCAKHNDFPMNYNSIFINECIGRILNN
ncbi:hypothetical protein MASR2M70_03570 [Bacillota bacterium]